MANRIPEGLLGDDPISKALFRVEAAKQFDAASAAPESKGFDVSMAPLVRPGLALPPRRRRGPLAVIRREPKP